MPSSAKQCCVIAFAGRRTDAANAEKSRFPFEQVPAVRKALIRLFLRERALWLVASGACGSDLAALEAAQVIGIRSRIVLPFSSHHFRRTSVIDRPHAEYWGSLFDRLTADATSRNDLVVLDSQESAPSSYSRVSRAIICEANLLASAGVERRRIAVIAWDGAQHSEMDFTKEFADLAIEAGFVLEEVSTSARR